MGSGKAIVFISYCTSCLWFVSDTVYIFRIQPERTKKSFFRFKTNTENMKQRHHNAGLYTFSPSTYTAMAGIL